MILFTVEGRGHFPIDMLRSEQAYPLNAQAVEGIANWDNEYARTRRKVELCGVQCTPARWESFMWKVV